LPRRAAGRKKHESAMSDLLNTIVRASRRRLDERKRNVSQSELERRVRDAEPARSLVQALSGGFSVIAEHKRRSPSGGAMQSDNVARAYELYAEAPWISAVSILTDLDHFDGSVEDLVQARAVVGRRPILRKDFVLDDYQVWEARAFGADAILLMTALFVETPRRLHELFDLAQSLGMDALVEIGMEEHPPERLAALVPRAARLWGVNSRKFAAIGRDADASIAPGRSARDASTALERHAAMRSLIPHGALAVAESGIHTADDLSRARAQGYAAALVGTAFLKGPRPIDAVIEEFSKVFGQHAPGQAAGDSRPASS
jgi:indole-3-glycerol phosphate synthase